MAKPHFFTETGSNFNQSPGQEFGPVSNTEYLVSSIHSWGGSEDPKAFAVLGGTVRYQQDRTNTDHLVAILKVGDPTGLNGLPVQFLIYRGIKKYSLLQSDNLTLVDNTPNDHIVNRIQQNSSSNPNYLSLGLGIKESDNQLEYGEIEIGNEEKLERLFYNEYESGAHHVVPGVILGEFDKNGFSFEVVLESLWRGALMEDVREFPADTGHKITIDTSEDAPKQKADREAILNYLDPVCLWSHFFENKLTTDSSGAVSRNDLYNEVIKPYINKNRIYLDVRNENNLSLNFYDSYGGIQLKNINDDNFETLAYSTNSWPIKIIDSSYIKTLQNDNATKIHLTLPADNNDLKLCYLYHAPIFRELLEWLPFTLTFLTFTKDLKGKDKFLKLLVDENSSFTSEIILSSNQVDDSGEVPVAYYFRLFYPNDYIDQSTAGNDYIGSNHALDNLFHLRPLDELLKFKAGNNTRWWFDGHMKYIKAKVPNHPRIQYSGMYKTGVAIDESNVTLFAIPITVYESNKQPKISRLPDQISQGKTFLELLCTDKTGDLGKSKIGIQNSNGQNRLILDIYSKHHEETNQFEAFDHDTILGITLTRTEYDHIQNNLPSQPGSSTSLEEILHPIFLQAESDGDEAETSNSDVKSFRQMKLRLVGFNTNGLREVSQLQGSSDIPFYSLRGQYYNSDNAAAQEGDPIKENPYGFFMGNDPNGGSQQYEYYDRVQNILSLVKIHLPDLFKDLERQNTGITESVPVFKNESGGAVSYQGAQKIIRYYKITIKIGEISEPNLDGVAQISIADVQVNGDSVPSTATTQILTEDSTYNKNHYEDLAVTNQNLPVENQNDPQYIANNYQPKIHVEDTETGDLEMVNGTSLIGSGRPIISTDINITLNKNLYTKTDDEGNLSYPDESIVYKAFHPNTQQSTVIGEFDNGTTELDIKLASMLAHEFGHVIYAIKNPTMWYLWKNLEQSYQFAPNFTNYDVESTSVPFYSGPGHLEGMPGANKAAQCEYQFNTNVFVKTMWPEAVDIIRSYNGHNSELSIFNFKSNNIPFHLDPIYSYIENEIDEIEFKIRSSIKGNLKLAQSEFPPKIVAP